MNSFKKSFFVLFISLIFVLVAGVVATNYAHALSPALTFHRNLSIGDSGEDVLELQRMLNGDPDTRIALSGPGSPGQETQYFGQLTHNAIIKFQNKHREEVLAPVGLSVGTGFFGPSTRSKLNSGNFEISTEVDHTGLDEILQSLNLDVASIDPQTIQIIQTFIRQTNTTQTTSQTNTTQTENTQTTESTQVTQPDSNEPTDNNEPIIFVMSRTVFEKGADLFAIGRNLKSNTKLYFVNSNGVKTPVNNLAVGTVDDRGKNFTPISGSETAELVKFDAPGVSSGYYDLYLEDGVVNPPIQVRVVRNYDPPHISSISYPGNAISFGDTVTITGSDFTDENIIVTPVGHYVAGSNNGVINFVVKKPDNYVSPDQPVTFEYFIMIKNSNGDSNVKRVNFYYN